jgi:hypothetical protein
MGKVLVISGLLTDPEYEKGFRVFWSAHRSRTWERISLFSGLHTDPEYGKAFLFSGLLTDPEYGKGFLFWVCS